MLVWMFGSATKTKGMNRGVLSLILLVVCWVNGWSQQGSLTGRVMFKDGQPAVNAILHLREASIYAVTNLDGEFEVSKVPYGRYTVSVSSIEARPTELAFVMERPDALLSIVAERSVNHINEVMVNGAHEKKEVRAKGFAVNVIDTKGLEMQSIQTNELLDRSAGVRIRQGGGLGSRIEYNINGLSGNSIRIFIDGIPIANYGSSFSLSSIPSSMIERIEVYKGVVPAHLSDDALGGAINVVLKKNNANTLGASYSVGSFNTHQANVSGSYRNDTTGFTAKGSFFYNYSDNNYKVWGDQVYVTQPNGKIAYLEAERFHDRYRSGGANVEVGVTDVPWADRLMLGAVMSQMDKQAQHGATMEVVYGRRFSEQTTRMLNLSYQKNDALIEGLDVNLFASRSWLNRQVVDTSAVIYNWKGELSDFNNDGRWDRWASGAEGSSPTLEESHERVYTTRGNVSYRLFGHSRVAVSYLFNDFKRVPDDVMRADAERELLDTRKMQKNIVAFTFENHAFNKRLRSSWFVKHYVQTLGLKDPVKTNGVLSAFEFDKQTRETGYGLALSYNVWPRVALLLSAEKAIRMPEHSEVFGNSAENIDSAYDLDPEQSNNANWGFNLGPWFWNKHTLGIHTNFFYRDTRDMIRQAVASQQSETFAFENQDVVLSTGMDAEVTYGYDNKLQVTLAVSNFNARFNKEYDAYGARYIYYGDRLRNEPYFTANNHTRYHVANVLQQGSRITLSHNWAYVHEFFRDWPSLGGANKAIIPTQSVHDFGVSYSFPGYRFTLSVDAKNVFNHQVFDNWALQKPGRAFYAKLNYRLY